jgi:TolB-like protein/DNA-binding winged helix-turn-helix (wHTH) protein
VPAGQPPLAYRFGDVVFDVSTFRLTRGGQVLRVEPKALDVLLFMVRHPGVLLGKQELVDAVWKGVAVTDNALARAVTHLRRVLEDTADHPRYIETVHTRGYRFIAAVEEVHPFPEARVADPAGVRASGADTAPAPQPIGARPPARVLEIVRSESGRGTAAVPRRAALEPVLAAEPVLEPSPPPAARPWRARLRARPVVVVGLLVAVAVALAAGAALRPRGVPTSPQLQSLAVLPLEDASEGPAYFADGLTEEITTEISRLARLQKVINRRSVMQYKGSAKTASVIARELGVDALVTGTVFRTDDRVRVTAQLVDGRNDRVLWAGTAERALGDVLLLHRELVRDLMRAANLQPLPGARETVDWVDPAAYDAYLRGLDGFNTHMPPERIGVALDALREAVERDPGFARAHALLAIASIHAGMNGLNPPRVPAREAADRALALDGTIGEAHAAKGLMLDLWEWQWQAAEEAHRRALELAPNSSLVRMAAARHFGLLGRYDEALREARWAVALDPTAKATHLELSWVLLHARRFEEAGAMLRSVLADADPREPFADFGLTLAEFCDARLGRVSAACVRGADRPVCGLAHAMAGNLDEGQRVLRTSCDPFDTPRNRGIRYPCLQLAAALGDREPLLRRAELVARERRVMGGFLRGPDMYDYLRDEPRFQAALREVGLVQ